MRMENWKGASFSIFYFLFLISHLTFVICHLSFKSNQQMMMGDECPSD